MIDYYYSFSRVVFSCTSPMVVFMVLILVFVFVVVIIVVGFLFVILVVAVVALALVVRRGCSCASVIFLNYSA